LENKEVTVNIDQFVVQLFGIMMFSVILRLVPVAESVTTTANPHQ